MPWEQTLAPLAGVPVLRLPYFALRPHGSDCLTVALCASSPLAKEDFGPQMLLPRLAAAYGELAREVRVHVFSDLAAYSAAGRYGYPADAVVHDPAEAAGYPAAARITDLDEGGADLNPWLLWMRDALGGRAVDVVHFAGHGYLSRGRGALAVAASPVLNTDQAWSRFVGIAQLSTFLSQVGAWSVAVTGTPANYSLTGLTALADSLAQLAPGYVLRHDMSAGDTSLRELQAGLRFLYAGSRRR